MLVDKYAYLLEHVVVYEGKQGGVGGYLADDAQSALEGFGFSALELEDMVFVLFHENGIQRGAGLLDSRQLCVGIMPTICSLFECKCPKVGALSNCYLIYR